MADELSPLATVLRAAHMTSLYTGPALWEHVATAAREHLSAAKPAAPTERPTCATCVHYSPWLDTQGDCLRFPASITKHSMQSCGDHPDFPAWIAVRAEGGR